MAIKGGCLCGKVRYEIAGSLTDADHCHSSMCRRQHGAAFSTYAGFNLGDFTWVTGENFVKTYQSLSGGGWCFCSECGSTLAGTCNDNITAITLGTVEGDPRSLSENSDRSEAKAILGKISDQLRRIACYLTNFSGNFNKIGLVAVD